MQDNRKLVSPVLGVTTITYPKPVGEVELVPGYVFCVNKLPNKFHQVMLRLILGFKFRAYKD